MLDLICEAVNIISPSVFYYYGIERPEQWDYHLGKMYGWLPGDNRENNNREDNNRETKTAKKKPRSKKLRKCVREVKTAKQ